MLPGADWKPAGHEVQEEAPPAEYVFAGQTLHEELPDIFLKVPAAHATHGPTSDPVYPGLHEHAVTLTLPADEFALTGQLVHAAVPFVGLYVPDEHIVHWPLEAPVSGPV